MKRIRLFLLLSLLALSMTMQAASMLVGNLVYTYDTKTHLATLVGFGPSGQPTTLTVPATVTISGANYTVTEIFGGICKGSTKLTSLDIQGAVKINANAFENCTALTSVALNGKASTIGTSAFKGCTALTTVSGMNAVPSVADSAFANCSKASDFGSCQSLVSIGKYAFLNCSSIESFNLAFWETYSNSKTYGIGEGAFMNCSKMGLWVLPPTLASIPKRCFYGCKNLQFTVLTEHRKDDIKNGDITNNLQDVGEEAFANCTNMRLQTAYQESSGDYDGWAGLHWFWPIRDAFEYTPVKTFGNKAFYNCTNAFDYSGFAIPSSLYSIGDEAFRKCTNMSSIDFTKATNLTTIGEGCFRECKKIGRTYGLANTKLTSIPAYAFADCDLFWIDGDKLNGKITSIGNYALQNDTTIGFLTLDATTTTIGNGAFYKCKKFKAMTIPSGNKLATIGNSAFYGCESLYDFNFPTSSVLTSIGTQAFYGCAKLTDDFKTLANTKLATVGSKAFFNCTGLTYIDFPSTINSIAGGDVFGYNMALIGISVASGGNSYYKADYGHPLISADGKTFLCYPAKHTTLTKYNNSTKASANAVSADFINGYLIPAGVTTISDYAFQGCEDTHVVLPNSVTTIGTYAFDQCNNMTEMTIPANVTSWGVGALANSGINSIYMLGTTLFSMGSNIANTSTATLYVKSSALSTFKNSAMWSSRFKEITDAIPYVASNAYQSRCFDFDVDLSSSALKAYTVTGFDSSTGKVKMTEISYIPSRINNGNVQTSYTGAIIFSADSRNSFKIGEKATQTTALTNCLVGCPGTHWMTATYSGSYNAAPSRYYALKNGKFCRYTAAGRIPYNRAYLDGSKASIPSGYGADVEMIFFDEDGNDVTAIEQLEAGVTEEKENGAYYNLNGVKVENPSKGIYIHNGKKVVIK